MVSLVFLLTAFVAGLISTVAVVLHVKKKNRSERPNINGLKLQKSNYGTMANSAGTSVNTESLESSAIIAPLGQVPSAGTWEHDLTGNYLSRFVVLILFLLFSCLVVSTVTTVTNKMLISGYSCGVLATGG